MQPAAPIRYGPLWTRGFHAFNLLVLLLMAASGLQIYNANPVFGGRGGATVPELFTLGGWLVYTLMLIVLGFSLITGMAMVKPAQLWWLVSLFSFA